MTFDLADRLLRYILLGPVLRLIYRPRVTGAEHLPRTGPVILASNHLAFCDSMFLPLAAGRPIAFLGKAEYFTNRGLRARLVGALVRAVGTIPVDRSDGASALASLTAMEQRLRQGRVCGIYPEGTRSPDGDLHRGRTGVARLALHTGAPVIPCAVLGTDRVQPRGTSMPRIARVEVRFGPPVDLADYAGEEHDRATLRAATDQIMATIAGLSGQRYVDTDAARIKRRATRPHR